jgi:hypothetical protein
MPKFIIERDMPGVGNLGPQELRGASAKSNSVINELGPEIKWIESFVTANKVYCVYIAPNEEILQEHARCSGFPANRISKVTAKIDPATGE